MNLKKLFLIVAAIVLVAVVPIVADLVTWDGGAAEDRWFLELNWDSQGLDQLPAEGDQAVHNIVANIVYNLDDPNATNPGIASLSGSGADTYSLVVEGLDSILTSTEAMDYTGAGTYTITVKPGAELDIGDWLLNFGPEPNLLSSTSGFTWVVDPAPHGSIGGTVYVTGTIFDGLWEVHGQVLAGTIDTLDPWTIDGGNVNVDNVIDATDWLIDGGSVTVFETGTFHDVEMNGGSLLGQGSEYDAALGIHTDGTIDMQSGATLGPE